MIKIIVDSAADCSVNDSAVDYVVPLAVNIDGTLYLDGVDLSKDQFYDFLVDAKEFPKTSCPSPQQFVEVFEEIKENGDEAIYFALSSGLSGTYQSANLAKGIVEYEGIHIVDTLTATAGIRILVDYAKQLIDAGASINEIVEKCETVKNRIKIFAGLDTLEFLQKGGRLSKGAAVVGELANLKPIITVNSEGKVDAYKKCVGVSRALIALTKDIQEYVVDTNFPVYSLVTKGEENPAKLEKKANAKGIEIAKRVQVGPTIGAHVGPEVYGVVFVCNLHSPECFTSSLDNFIMPNTV